MSKNESVTLSSFIQADDSKTFRIPHFFTLLVAYFYDCFKARKNYFWRNNLVSREYSEKYYITLFVCQVNLTFKELTATKEWLLRVIIFLRKYNNLWLFYKLRHGNILLTVETEFMTNIHFHCMFQSMLMKISTNLNEVTIPTTLINCTFLLLQMKSRKSFFT